MIVSEPPVSDPGEPAAPGGEGQDELVELMVRLVRELERHDDVHLLARRLVELTVDHLHGAGSASITVPRGGAFLTLAATDDRARRADQAQYDTGEGPCLAVAVSNLTVLHSADVGKDLRWPRFGRRAVDLRVGSVLSFALPSAARNLGSLNVYAGRPFAFAPHSDQFGRLLAVLASPLLEAAGQRAELRAALATDTLVARAQGMLMERLNLGADRALAALAAIASGDGRSLAEVARLVTDRPSGND